MSNDIVETKKIRSVVESMAKAYDMEREAFEAVVRETVMPGNVKQTELVAFLSVAKEYGLNPLLKEVYAFPSKGGGIQPIVSIDGWCRIINNHPKFDGAEFKENFDNGKLVSITCKMHRKDRDNPIEITEYLTECSRNTEPWKQWPVRMLRHKALIQCARYAFGFSGIMEEDEWERFNNDPKDITPKVSNETLVERYKKKEPSNVIDLADIKCNKTADLFEAGDDHFELHLLLDQDNDVVIKYPQEMNALELVEKLKSLGKEEIVKFAKFHEQIIEALIQHVTLQSKDAGNELKELVK